MPAVLCILFLLLLLCFPELCVRGASDGLALWLFTLVPSFFPFLFLSNLMVSCGAADDVSRLCGRILRPLFRTSEPGAYILFMGFLCGYPMGAKLTAEFVRTERISREEGRMLLTFCNNPSPMFLLGFVLTDCMQEPYSKAGTLAMFYAAPILTGLLMSRLAERHSLRNGHRKFAREFAAASSHAAPEAEPCPVFRMKHDSKHRYTEIPSHASFGTRAGRNVYRERKMSARKTPLMAQIRSSMSDAFATLLYLGGYVILFHIGSALILSLAGYFPAGVYPVFCLLAASLEMSGGAAYLAASGLPAGFINLFVPLCVIFGGICIMAQTAGLLSDSGLSVRPCILGKLLQVAVAAGIWLLQTVL